jgi:hypothetical protein
MSELVKQLGSYVDQAYLVLLAVAAVFAVVGIAVAVAAMTYSVQAALAPLIRIGQWLFAYAPGARPNDITAGVAHGLRMVAWAGLIGLGLWFLIHNLGDHRMKSRRGNGPQAFVMQGEEPPARGPLFLLSLVATVAAGVGLLTMALYYFRPPHATGCPGGCIAAGSGALRRTGAPAAAGG